MSEEKRSFSFDTASLSTVAPLLDTGFYAGVIDSPAITGKGGKEFFKIQEEKVWNKNNKEMELTGKHQLTGLLMYRAILTSKRAIKELQRDEPMVFGSPIFLRFDADTDKMLDSSTLGNLLKVFDLKETNFDELIDWEYDEDIEVPTEFESVENIIQKLNALEYYKSFFTVICQSLEGLPCKVNVIKKPTRDNPSIQENSINITASSCGFIPYEEGSEEDLTED